MIAGDYLYTNYLCRIANLLMGAGGSNYVPKFKYSVVKMLNEEFFFRYDESGDGFILTNQYGEENVNEDIKSLIALFIAYGTNTCDVKINGEGVKVTPRSIFLLSYIMNLIDKQVEPLKRGCSERCLFENVCPFTPIGAVNMNTIGKSALIEGFIQSTSIIPNLVSSGDACSAGVSILQRLMSRAPKPIREDDFLRDAKIKLSEEIGIEKANFVFQLAWYIAGALEIPKISVDPTDYGGYLVYRDDILIPSDRFWNIIYGRDMEDAVVKLIHLFKKYSYRWGYFEWDWKIGI